jgi:hypothetical protein
MPHTDAKKKNAILSKWMRHSLSGLLNWFVRWKFLVSGNEWEAIRQVGLQRMAHWSGKQLLFTPVFLGGSILSTCLWNSGKECCSGDLPKVCTPEECFLCRHIHDSMSPLETCSSGGPSTENLSTEHISWRGPKYSMCPKQCNHHFQESDSLLHVAASFTFENGRRK